MAGRSRRDRCGGRRACGGGETIRYVVRDAQAGLADCAWEADYADRLFYRRILAKAWGEVAAGLGQPAKARSYTPLV